MIGTKIYKSDMTNYFEVAEWCNFNGATIEDKGSYYEVVAIPAPSLDELKRAKLSEVNAWTERKIVGGFISSASGQDVYYDSDKDTQLTMQGIALNVNTPLFEQEYPNGCPVRGYLARGEGKTIFLLSADQVLRWMADLSMHIGDCKQAGWAKQEEVKAATTKEELDKIVLE